MTSTVITLARGSANQLTVPRIRYHTYPLRWKYRAAVSPNAIWMSYDPDLDLLYYGTGNPAPYNAEQRPGDNKWTSSVLARRPSDVF